MSENLISFDECSAIIQQLDEGKSCKVIDYAVTNYSDGYPGFLGDYFSLKIKFRDVRKSSLRCSEAKTFS